MLTIGVVQMHYAVIMLHLFTQGTSLHAGHTSRIALGWDSPLFIHYFIPSGQFVYTNSLQWTNKSRGMRLQRMLISRGNSHHNTPCTHTHTPRYHYTVPTYTHIQDQTEHLNQFRPCGSPATTTTHTHTHIHTATPEGGARR